MKLMTEIIEVSASCDGLRVKLQGKAEYAADWRPIVSQTIELPDTAATRRAFYVGRKVALIVEAK